MQSSEPKGSYLCVTELRSICPERSKPREPIEDPDPGLR